MRYHAKSRTLIYRSKMHSVLKRNFEVFPGLDWLTGLTANIPNPGEHAVRYYGRYTNVSRGKRKKTQAGTSEGALTEVVEVPPPAISRGLKHRWAYFIKQVYEADPLVCPQCGGPMRIIGFIEQPEVIEEVLSHPGPWPARAHSPPAGYPLPSSLQRVVAA